MPINYNEEIKKLFENTVARAFPERAVNNFFLPNESQRDSYYSVANKDFPLRETTSSLLSQHLITKIKNELASREKDSNDKIAQMYTVNPMYWAIRRGWSQKYNLDYKILREILEVIFLFEKEHHETTFNNHTGNNQPEASVLLESSGAGNASQEVIGDNNNTNNNAYVNSPQANEIEELIKDKLIRQIMSLYNFCLGVLEKKLYEDKATKDLLIEIVEKLEEYPEKINNTRFIQKISFLDNFGNLSASNKAVINEIYNFLFAVANFGDDLRYRLNINFSNALNFDLGGKDRHHTRFFVALHISACDKKLREAMDADNSEIVINYNNEKIAALLDSIKKGGFRHSNDPINYIKLIRAEESNREFEKIARNIKPGIYEPLMTDQSLKHVLEILRVLPKYAMLNNLFKRLEREAAGYGNFLGKKYSETIEILHKGHLALGATIVRECSLLVKQVQANIKGPSPKNINFIKIKRLFNNIYEGLNNESALLGEMVLFSNNIDDEFITQGREEISQVKESIKQELATLEGLGIETNKHYISEFNVLLVEQAVENPYVDKHNR